MKNGIELEGGGTAPCLAVSIDDMARSVTSSEVELKL